MTAAFLVVPQWQGSPSSRAMRLAEGAAAIRSDLPAAATRDVVVPLEAGDDQGTGVARFSSLQLVRERLRDGLQSVEASVETASTSGVTPVVIGGDCAVSDAAVRHAAEKHGEIALIWFDAHPDLNSTETSPSGAYAGMVLRSLIDDGVVAATRVLLAGTRSWDEGEDAYATEAGIHSLTVDELADAGALVEAVVASGASSVYVHVDLDVLDPSEITGLLDPEPFGLAASTLIATIKALRERFDLAGATIAASAPASEADAMDDAPTILRIIGALAA